MYVVEISICGQAAHSHKDEVGLLPSPSQIGKVNGGEENLLYQFWFWMPKPKNG